MGATGMFGFAGIRARRAAGVAIAVVVLATMAATIGPSPAGAAPADVMINEIHFHPTCDVNYSPCNDAGREFVELHNNSNDTVDLSGWQFTDGVDFTFPAGASIGPFQHVVIADDVTAFQNRWGFTPYEWSGKLSNSGETLALANAAGAVIDMVSYNDGSKTAGEWSVVADGDGNSLQLADANADNALPSMWVAASPNPGESNPAQNQPLTPAVENLTWTVLPNANTNIQVSADVYGSSNVVLEYRINYPGTTRSVTMTSNNDRTFTASIPSSSYGPGDLVRLRISVAGTARAPRQDDSIEWVGTTVVDPAVNTTLPHLQWYSSNSNYNSGYNEQGSTFYDGVLAYDGIVYDNIGFRIRGGIARTAAWSKRNWKIKLPDHHEIQIGDFSYAIDTMDLQGGFADEARIREYLGHTMAADMGLVASEVQHVRLDFNGSFFGLHTLQEHPDADFLKERDLQNATLHKGARSSSYSRQGGPNRSPDWSVNFENWDIPEYINMLAAASVIQHNDFAHGNFYWWYDADEHGRFEGMIWDLDLSQGIRNAPTSGLTTRIFNGNDQQYLGPSWSYVWHRWINQTQLFDDVLSNPTLRQMYLRRLRTLADEWYGTGKLETLARDTYADIGTEWQADTQRWGFWGNQNFGQQRAIDRYANDWIDQYYAHLNTGGPDGDIPGAQPAVPGVSVTVVQAPADQRNEHVRLNNNEAVAIDVSGWQIGGSANITLPPGSVIPANGAAYVVDNDLPAGFRAVTNNLLVLAQYGNALDDANGSITLTRTDGSQADQVNWGQAVPPTIILNEWNAVDADTLIEDTDPFFGPVPGNGGDWFELVVVEDNVDLRGYQLEISDADNAAGVPEVTDTFVLGNDQLLADVRSGTIITVAEDVADDASYNPAAGDWTINLQANSADEGSFITAGSQSNFNTNNQDWQLRILNPAGGLVFGPAGEGANGVGGVGGSETGELEADPSAAVDLSAYGDSKGSTFAAANIFGEQTQNFDLIRNVDPPVGASIGDAVTNTEGAPVSGVGVDLFAADAQGNRLSWLDFTSTNATGIYGFSVDPGCYAVVFIAPAGQTFVGGDQYNEQALCLTAGETNNTIDAVLDNGGGGSATIGDTVTYTAGGGAPGVAIDLFAADAEGNRSTWIRATTTDASGSYNLPVEPGCYAVVFIAPAGQTFVGGAQYNEQALCLAAGETNNTIDAVLDNGGGGSATIGDAVTYTAGGGAPGITVDLFAADAQGNRQSWLDFTTTDGSGNYGFTVEPGCYAVVFLAPAGQTFVGGNEYFEASTCVEAGGNDDTIDAVLNNGGGGSATIGDSVTFAAGGGASGVAIDLYPANADGSRGIWQEATSTDGSGTYGFSVSAGCYVVVFIAPAGQTFVGGDQYNEQGLCLAGGETNNAVDAVLN